MATKHDIICAVRHLLSLDYPLEDEVTILFHAQPGTYAFYNVVLGFTFEVS